MGVLSGWDRIKTNNKMKLILLSLLSIIVVIQGDINIRWTITGQPLTKRCVTPGDNVVFNWGGRAHNVEQVYSMRDYDNCSRIKNRAGERGPYTFSAKNEGTYYFVCGVGGHCQWGKQKVIVEVKNFCP